MISRRGFLLTTLAALPTGCAHVVPWSGGAVYSNPSRCQLPQGVTGPAVIAHLNQNINQLTGWRATSARVSMRGNPMTAGAMITVDAPTSFRLVVNGPVGGPIFDMGSNDEECWVWAKDHPQKQIMTCRLDQLDRARRRFPVPIEPSWVMEVLGVMPFDEEQLVYEELPPVTGGQPRAQLVGTLRLESGEEWRKSTLVDTCHGLVLEHTVHDSHDRQVARAVLTGHARQRLPSDNRFGAYGATGPVMPSRIDLEWPDAKLDLSIALGQVDVNARGGSSQYTIPSPPGFERIDLST
jgi:hypothetical protein